MSWTIARADNDLYPTPPNPAVFPRASVATVPYATDATNFPKAVWCDFANQSDDLVPQLEAAGVTVVTDHNAYANVRAVGSVVGVWDDSRVSTPDGAVFPAGGTSGEGLLGGRVASFDGLTALTLGFEFVVTPGLTAPMRLCSSDLGSTATDFQFSLFWNSSRLEMSISDGVATIGRVRSAVNSSLGGVRYFGFARFDGSQPDDLTKLTFWLASYDPLTNVWSAVAQSAGVVITAGIPTAIPTISTALWAVGRFGLATSGVFNGVIGGNGTRVFAIPSALTETQMNNLVQGSITPASLSAIVSYNFSGGTPYANLGTAGAVGNLTAGANTVLCSGDRRYAQLASPGTSRPSYVTSGVAPVCTFDGVNDYLRNVSVGQLEGITADAMIAYIGTVPASNASKFTAELSASTTRALALLSLAANPTNSYGVRVNTTVPSGVFESPPPTSIRSILASRTASGSGTISYRNGLAAPVTATETPAGGTVTRFTIGGSAADTPANFAGIDATRILTLRGVTDANVRQAVAELVSAWAARYAGATV
jgi:hypothetical protein